MPQTGSGICQGHISNPHTQITFYNTGHAYLVGGQLAIGTDIEQAARGVVGAGTECISVGEELDGVDVRVVGGKSLHALLLSDIPQLGEGIARARDKLVVIESTLR